MIHATSHSRQIRLATDYRAADIHQAADDRAQIEAKRAEPESAEAAKPRAAGAFARLVTLLPHSH